MIILLYTYVLDNIQNRLVFPAIKRHVVQIYHVLFSMISKDNSQAQGIYSFNHF